MSNEFQLAVETDEVLVSSLLPIGRQLLMTSVDLDEFVQKGLDEAEKDFEAESTKKVHDRTFLIILNQIII